MILRVETAENMNKNKIVILTNPCNKPMIQAILASIKEQIDKQKDEGE